MYKKFAAIGFTTLLITGYVSPAEAIPLERTPNVLKVNSPAPMLDEILQNEKATIQNIQRLANEKRIGEALSSLNKHVGKTWYVFSGSTPSGWDCSGLTMWFYEQLGIQLEHRASKQEYAGEKTNNPKPGDLVVFKYNGSKSAYHVGIYVGNGEMIHAPRKGEVTRIESVKQFGGNYSKISYISFIETA
jgi:cell wall-associated NlpC family hydrolase